MKLTPQNLIDDDQYRAVFRHYVDVVREDVFAKARKDINFFIPLVLRDERTGSAITQADIHRTWHALADEHDRLILLAFPESGKAVPLNTPIPTPDGWRTMGSLGVGDWVFARNGKPCRVTYATKTQRNRVLYRITFDDGNIVLADADHQWIVNSYHDGRRKDPNFRRVMTTQAMVDSGVRIKDFAGYHKYKWRIPLCQPVHYQEQSLPIHPYVLGAWLGDGHSSRPILTFHKNDRYVWDRCIELVGGDAVPRSSKVNPNVYTAGIGSQRDMRRPRGNSLLGKLKKLRVLNNKHIPEQYLLGSIEQRRELLAGLLDTDGYLSNKAGNTSQVELTSKYPALAFGVLELARSLGFKARIKQSDSTLYGRVVGKRYRVFFTARVPVFRLPRKLAKQKLERLPTRANYRCITAIDRVDSVPVRCISVDSEDNSYLMERSYTVTHNTSQLAVGRVLWMLGREPNLRIAIVSNSYGQAEKIIGAISQNIETNKVLHGIFPNLKPGKRKSDKWTQEAITIERPWIAKDPSVQAFGVGGQILGSRVDVLIVDDILDWESCRTNYLREKTIQQVQANLFGRLTAKGRIIVIGNAFHPQDLLHALANRGWPAYRYPVLDDTTGEPRWPEVWPMERIQKRKEELSGIEFARQMLCIARDDKESRFKSAAIEMCKQAGEGKTLCYGLNFVPPNHKIVTGVDLAVQRKDSSDLSCLFTIAVKPDGTRVVLNIESGRWSGNEIGSRIIDNHRRYQSLIIIENNAAQDFLLQWVRDRAVLPMRAYTTTAAKAHPEFGIESLAAEMEQGKWVIPNENGRCHPEVEAWINEMLYYSPDAHTGDRLMSSFFAREGIRMSQIKVESGYVDFMSR